MKKNLFKKFLVINIVLAMAAPLFPRMQIFAADTSDAEGWVSWMPVQSEGESFYPPMQAETGKEEQVKFSFVNDDTHSSDQNGAIKAERHASGGIQLKLDSGNDHGAAVLPKRENEVVVAARVKVWADEDAAGSTLASYAFHEGTDYTAEGTHFNGAYNNKEVRTLQQGWNTLYFDITQCKYLGFLYWQSTSSKGTIYLDDFKLKYVSVDDPMDSFDHFENDWVVGDAEAFTLSQNTDLQYVKDGTGSIKVDIKSNKDTYLLQTKLFDNGEINGKLIPQFEGYTPKNIGFWVYIVDGANVLIGSAGSDRKIRVNKPGWNYVNYDLYAEHTNSYYRNDFKKITQLMMRGDSGAGTVIYLDGLTVEYEKDDEVVAERFNSDSIWFGLENNGSSINCYDYRALQDNGKYVKEGFTSAKLTLPKGVAYGTKEIATTAWRDGGMPAPADEDGNTPSKLGMWVYGSKDSGVQLAVNVWIGSKDNTQRTARVPIDFDGWKQIWFNLPEGTTSIYGIRYSTSKDKDAELYIDKMTYKYPTEVTVNELLNGSEKLDMETVKQGDTIRYRVELTNEDFAKTDVQITVAAYNASDQILNVDVVTCKSDSSGKIKGEAQITVDTPEMLEELKRVKGFCWTADSLIPVCTAAAKFVSGFGDAGMIGTDDETAVEEGATTLTEIDLLPVTRTRPQTAQLGNANPYQTLIYKNSDKLPENISGVALSDDGTALNAMRGIRGVAWAAGWLNDGEVLYGKTETCYSSAMHSSAYVDEWAMLKFSKPQTITQINILPRQGGWCFPSDYTIEISSDGENWKIVAEEKNKKVQSAQDIQSYEITPTECRYVRLNATKLSSDGKNYYLQLREIEALDENGNNVGLYTNGTSAEGSNPLSTNEIFDYDEYFNSIFDSGVKWVNIPNTRFWDKTELSPGEKENLKYLKDNGVNVTYRFTHEIGDISLEDAEVLGDEFADRIELIVNELKDYVDVWQIANEENFNGKPYSSQKPASYAAVVSKVADRIRKLDPGCKIEIETALIDFEWTKNVMEAGLAGKIDVMGVHVYKEVDGADNMIEANGTFINNGVRMFPKDHPYKDYREEITEYKKLMEKYNPGSEVWVTETSVNLGLGRYTVTELVQAKYLARAYIYHQMLGVGPTCWWTLHSIKTGETVWGLIDSSYTKRDGWYALRNVANTMNNNFKKEETVIVSFSNGENMIFDVFKNDSGVYQIPYWVMVKMRSANTGRPTDITVRGIEVKNAVAIDMITGTVQELNFESNGDTTVFHDMVARDYPIVIRINSDEQYDKYTVK